MNRKRHPASSLTTQQGFSMLEVLITLVIIAIALFGTAGLQAYAMRMNQSGQLRTQAVFLAADIAERMEANKLGAFAGNYVVATSNAPSVAGTDCAAGACGAADLADWDISQWETAIAGDGANNAALLPHASWTINQTATSATSITYTIIITWTDRSSNKATTGETFTHSAIRTIGI
jgi:type IV pilus assembly protein PilV